MRRLVLSLLAFAVVAGSASAHFVYVVPAKDGKSVRVVFSDSLEADENVSIDKIAALKLTARDAKGQNTPLELKKGEHQLDGALAADTKAAFGTLNYGLSTKGDRPYVLMYYPKLVLAGTDEKTATLGEKAPVELVPVATAGSIRFKVLVAGKPAPDIEVSIVKADGEKAKLKTDSTGLTEKLDGAGRYAAWAKHTEMKDGEVDGKKFAEIRHYATLVVDVSQ